MYILIIYLCNNSINISFTAFYKKLIYFCKQDQSEKKQLTNVPNLAFSSSWSTPLSSKNQTRSTASKTPFSRFLDFYPTLPMPPPLPLSEPFFSASFLHLINIGALPNPKKSYLCGDEKERPPYPKPDCGRRTPDA